MAQICCDNYLQSRVRIYVSKNIRVFDFLPCPSGTAKIGLCHDGRAAQVVRRFRVLSNRLSFFILANISPKTVEVRACSLHEVVIERTIVRVPIGEGQSPSALAFASMKSTHVRHLSSAILDPALSMIKIIFPITNILPSCRSKMVSVDMFNQIID